MRQYKEGRRPASIQNLAQLKRAIKPGVEIVATCHAKHPALNGVTRVVTTVQTNGFYTRLKDPADPNAQKYQHFWSPYAKAGYYKFHADGITLLDPRSKDGSILYKLKVFDMEQTISENEPCEQFPVVERAGSANGETTEYTDAQESIGCIPPAEKIEEHPTELLMCSFGG